MATGVGHSYLEVHPLTRDLIKSLSVHPLYAAYQPGLTERKNITADLDEFAVYPSIDHSGIGNAYARFLRQTYPRLSIGHDEILFTRGSVEALELLVRAFCEPQTEPVMVTPPFFSEYERFAVINGNPVIRVPLVGEDFERWT